MSPTNHLPRIVSVLTTGVLIAAVLAAASTPAADAADQGQGTSGLDVTKRELAKDAASTPPRAGLPAGVPASGRFGFLLKLSTRSTGSAFRRSIAKGKVSARAAAKSQLRTVTSAQNRVIGALPKKSRVLYRSHAVISAVSVVADVKNLQNLTRIDGVEAVYPISPKAPSNAFAVPRQHAPQAWQAHANRGADSTVAIIDSGIDYTHANFGGVGTVDEYDASKAQRGEPLTAGEFPGPKVIGGYDLAGDDYDASSQPVPSPDPWPLDCYGHGSHVAGTAAGYGVDANGDTYDGDYDTSTPFSDLRIGPGMAPEAKLIALRVFGCEGSTNLVAAAIDRAADPNQDGDTSDHADVVNISLGSAFGSPEDGDSVAVDAASALGMTMVVAAGNSGDVFDVSGSPGNAPSALTVAASQDDRDQVDALTVNAPDTIQGLYASDRSTAYDWAHDPDLSGEVAQVTEESNTDACLPLSAADQAAVNNKIALVEWAHDEAARRCGSESRAAHLVAAGATGVIYADDEETFATGTTGNTGSAVTPGVLVAKSGADAIRGELEDGHTVTISGTTADGSAQLTEGLNDTVATFSSRGIGDAGNVKPDVTAVGAKVFSTDSGTGDEGAQMSGTSMATPMVAGEAALVATAHPDWDAKQVKADIMNTAGQDLYRDPGDVGPKYAPQRVGSGQIQVDAALDNEVLAYVTDDGSVSASFGPQAVSEKTTLNKTITVENTGRESASFDVSYVARTSVPGATYSVSPSSVTIAPESTKTVTVTLELDPSAMTKTHDPTIDLVRTEDDIPRQFQADASGLVVLESAGGDPDLRVPVYAAPRPAATMTQPDSLTLPTGPVQKAVLPLSGRSFDQGSGTSSTRSTIAGFELQATSGPAPDCAGEITARCVRVPDERSADLKYVGTTSSAPQLAANGDDPMNAKAYFAISTHGRWRAPAASQGFDVYIDGDRDGTADALLYTTRYPTAASDIVVTQLFDLKKNSIVSIDPLNDSLGDTDTAIFDSDTLVMSVPIRLIPGLTSETSRINYAVYSYSALQGGPVDALGDSEWLSFDPLHPGVAVYGSYAGGDQSALLYPDGETSVLSVRRDSAAYVEDGGMGAMLVHFHNAVGDKAQTMMLKTTPQVGLTLEPNPAQRGRRVTATVTVSNGDGPTSTGDVVVKSGSTTLAMGELADGAAQLTFDAPSKTGDYPLQAEYAGDEDHEASQSDSVNLTVTRTRPRIVSIIRRILDLLSHVLLGER